MVKKKKVAKKTVAASPKKKASSPKPPGVRYPQLIVRSSKEERTLTAADAKELLGWTEQTDEVELDRFHLKIGGVKVFCANNTNNRPLYWSTVLALKQEILRGRWKLNGEPIIVGKTGSILNGQHTLIALVLAEKEWETTHGADAPPTIEKLIVCGIEEGDDVVNTMDTCKPRSLSDVLYRSDYFQGLPLNAQRVVARTLDQAIKMLWDRTGVSDAFGTKRTHAEAVNFLENHRKLIDAVEYVYTEDDSDKKLARYLSPGYCATLLYLMGASASDAEGYFSEDTTTEESIDFSQWDTATDFFTLLAAGDKKLKPLRDAYAKMIEEGMGSVKEKMALLIKAWHLHVNDKPLNAKGLELEYVVKEDQRYLAENPLCGGIDVGDEGWQGPVREDPTDEDLEKVYAKKAEDDPLLKPNKNKAKKGKKAKEDCWTIGDTAWCKSSGDPDPYFLKIVGTPYKCGDGEERVMVETENGLFEEPTNRLTVEYPESL